MSLQEILNRIHATRSPSELNSKLNLFKQEISAELSGSDPFQENYYKNHTGRELFKKMNNYGLENLIPTSYDSGFRPDDTSLGLGS